MKMARAWFELLWITFMVLCFIQLSSWYMVMVLGNHSHLLQHHGSRPAMILPLYLSSADSSRTALNTRRYLRRSVAKQHPNARMSLYDDLLLNGYYTTRIWIGTPPQEFALIVDTGSSVTYVPCSTCEQCGKHQDPKFQPDLSSTYEPLKCSSNCNCDTEKGQCIYDRQYAEMSSSSGVLGVDVISFGNQSDLEPQRAVFGCENVETGDLYSQHADGIMGLGTDDLSIVDQLVEKGVISDSFSLCYGGMDIGGGAMVLGAISPPSDMVYAYSDPVRSPYYNIDLMELHVAGKQLPLDPKIFDGKHGTVLDSGTTYAYLPEAAFLAFREAITKELKSFNQIPGPDPNYHDICFSEGGMDASQLLKNFPVVDMVFGNGKKLSLSPENYLFRHSKVHGAYCLGIFQNGQDPTTLLGGIIARNTLVMYDREHNKIGFWKTNCSELWERLHISVAQPPLPQNSGTNDSNITLTPSLSPLGGPSSFLPEELPIAQLTVTISFNVSYSDMRPHVEELSKVIARKIHVKPSQVHLLDFSAIGNGSLFRLAITPPGSNDYISNATARNMISRLGEHQMQLPSNFVSYKLVKWNAEPPSKRTWWEKNYWAVVSIVSTLLVSLSAAGIYFIWKRRQLMPNTYKPLHLSVPEQELQPISTT